MGLGTRDKPQLLTLCVIINCLYCTRVEMATVVCGRGRWRVLCRAAADFLACLQCRRQGLLLPAHSGPSFLCSSSNAALKPECFYRERGTPEFKDTLSSVEQGSGGGCAARGGEASGSSAGSKRLRQQRGGSTPQASLSNRSTCAQESDRVRDFLKRTLTLDLGGSGVDARDVFLLCCALPEVEERVEGLLGAGFTKEWTATLLPLFPPLWDVDVSNMHEVFALLVERGFGGNSLKKLVSDHSYLLLEDRQLVIQHGGGGGGWGLHLNSAPNSSPCRLREGLTSCLMWA